jgi:hypothetical protein
MHEKDAFFDFINAVHRKPSPTMIMLTNDNHAHHHARATVLKVALVFSTAPFD